LAAPGTTDGLVLTFEPQASGDFDGTLVLESNDPMLPRIEIQVIGTAVDPDESDPNGDGGTNEDPDGRAKPTVIESEIQGCGCASTRADRTGGALLGAIGLAGLLWRRRRA
jgi:MYXO-CTERM domain-containing protein